MICDRYDVVVVPFPFDDILVSKRRPVLVLSGRTFNADSGQTIVSMITTAKKTTWPSDVVIADLAEAGLKHPCVVRLRLRTLPNAAILRRLGRLAIEDQAMCRMQLDDALTK